MDQTVQFCSEASRALPSTLRNGTGGHSPMEDNPSSLLINALRSTSYLLEAYGYNAAIPH